MPDNSINNDGELAALAKAIGGDIAPPTEPPVSSSGQDDKPALDADGKPIEPVVSGAAPTPGKEPSTDGKPADGTAAPPVPSTLEDLLKDTKLGPVLQSWKDKAAAASVQTALEQERAQHLQQLQSADLQQWVSYFKQFNKEELAELLASDEKIAAKYAETQQALNTQQQSVNSNQVATTAQLYSYAHQISVYNKMLADSGLTQEKLAELKAENFTHLGAAGINAWGQAVYSALLEHQTNKAVEEQLKTKWEAYKQEHLAELEPGSPPPAGAGAGSPGPGRLDLMKTPSELLLENALGKKK